MKETKEKKGKLGGFMGHSVVSVIRAMGVAGWTFPEAQAALEKAKVAPAENTIRIQLRAGAKKLAPPAEIDPKQLEALRPAKSADKANDKAGKPAPRKPAKAGKGKAAAKK